MLHMMLSFHFCLDIIGIVCMICLIYHRVLRGLCVRLFHSTAPFFMMGCWENSFGLLELDGLSGKGVAFDVFRYLMKDKTCSSIRITVIYVDL